MSTSFTTNQLAPFTRKVLGEVNNETIESGSHTRPYRKDQQNVVVACHTLQTLTMQAIRGQAGMAAAPKSGLNVGRPVRCVVVQMQDVIAFSAQHGLQL